jgi:SOS response associated peptidase (SRAP)
VRTLPRLHNRFAVSSRRLGLRPGPAPCVAVPVSPPMSARSSSSSRSRQIGRPRTSRPAWNVAPTDPLPVVRYDARAGERSLDVMRWDLVPFWAKDGHRELVACGYLVSRSQPHPVGLVRRIGWSGKRILR